MPTPVRDGSPAPKPKSGARGGGSPSDAGDEQAVLDLAESLKAFYTDQDEGVDYIRDMRLQRKRVALPDEYRLNDIEIRDPTITDELDRVVPTFTLNEPELTVTASPESGEAGQDNSTLREHWTKAMLRAAGTPRHGMATLQAAVDACAGDGGAITKFVFKNDLWTQRYKLRERDYADDDGYPDAPTSKSGSKKYTEAVEAAKREAGVPFKWIACDVRGCYPLIRDDEIVEVIEVAERPLHDCLRQYGLSMNAEGYLIKGLGDPVSASEDGSGDDAPTAVKFIEHWTARECTYVVQGGKNAIQVRTWRHGYGRVPYFTALGRMVNWWRNRKVGWSISQSKAFLVEYMSFLMTLHAQVACRDALPPMYEELPDGAIPLLGEDGKPIRNEKWQPGQIRIGPPGGKLSVPQFPTSSANLERHIALIRDQITQMDAPKAPNDLSSADNGFATSLVMSEARIKQDPIGQSIEQMLVDVTKFAWHLVRTKVREPVWVEAGEGAERGWLSAGPDDLGPGVGVRWRLNSERPNAQLVEARYWHERVREKTASRWQAIEAMGDNPDEVDEQIAWDEVRQSPQYRALLMQRLFEKVNRGDVLQKAVASQMAQTGVVPGVPGTVPPGGPGTPGGMPMGMGQLGGAPPAMGNGQVPDMGALTAAPNGAGAAPMNGVPGVSTGAGPPAQSAAPGIQSLGR